MEPNSHKKWFLFPSHRVIVTPKKSNKKLKFFNSPQLYSLMCTSICADCFESTESRNFILILPQNSSLLSTNLCVCWHNDLRAYHRMLTTYFSEKKEEKRILGMKKVYEEVQLLDKKKFIWVNILLTLGLGLGMEKTV